MKMRILLFCIVLLSLNGCGSGSLPAQELIEWVREPAHGLLAEKEISGFRFKVMYKPLDYVLATELLSGNLDPAEFTRRKGELSGMHYFDLDISATAPGVNPTHQGLGNSQEVQGRINYFSFGMKNDLSLESGGASQPCALYHYERSSDLGASRKFLLGFPRTATAGDLSLSLNSDEFGAGKINFLFALSTLNDIPQLEP